MKDTNIKGAKIMTFGFINNDKYNDLVTTDHNQQTISVHFFDSSTWKYQDAIIFSVDKEAHDMVITNVVIGKDRLDYQSLIVSYFKEQGDTHLTVKIFKYDLKMKNFLEFSSSKLNNMKM